MALPIANQNNGKKGNKNNKATVPGVKVNSKAGKAASFSKKPVKTGGTRGS